MQADFKKLIPSPKGRGLWGFLVKLSSQPAEQAGGKLGFASLSRLLRWHRLVERALGVWCPVRFFSLGQSLAHKNELVLTHLR